MKDNRVKEWEKTLPVARDRFVWKVAVFTETKSYKECPACRKCLTVDDSMVFYYFGSYQKPCIGWFKHNLFPVFGHR